MCFALVCSWQIYFCYSFAIDLSESLQLYGSNADTLPWCHYKYVHHDPASSERKKKNTLHWNKPKITGQLVKFWSLKWMRHWTFPVQGGNFTLGFYNDNIWRNALAFVPIIIFENFLFFSTCLGSYKLVIFEILEFFL